MIDWPKDVIFGTPPFAQNIEVCGGGGDVEKVQSPIVFYLIFNVFIKE